MTTNQQPRTIEERSLKAQIDFLEKCGVTNQSDQQSVLDFYSGQQESISDGAYDKLFHYYCFVQHEIPYGTAKARDGDPYEWVENKIKEVLKQIFLETE